MATASRILGDQVGSTAPAFLAILAVHVIAGLTAVITGAAAALARKGSPRHIRAGRWYYRALTTVFATAAALAAMRWSQDWYLFILGAVAFTAATAGVLHRRRHRRPPHRPRDHPREKEPAALWPRRCHRQRGLAGRGQARREMPDAERELSSGSAFTPDPPRCA